MNTKIVSSNLLGYLLGATFMLALQFAFSRDGLGNELMLFGFPLLSLFFTGLKYNYKRASRTDVIAIIVGCLAISLVSIPIHWMAPRVLLNPYSGPIAVLLMLPMLCVVHFIFKRFAGTSEDTADRDAG